MLTRCLAVLGLVGAFAASSAAAETCGGVYKVKRGDTLSQIADIQYKDAGKWTAIFQANSAKIGTNPNNIRVGAKYTLTCIGGLPVGLEGGTDVVAETAAAKVIASGNDVANTVVATAASSTGLIKLVTADDYAPFTDRKLPNGGLITDIVNTAFTKSADIKDHKVYVVNDWAAHLDPLIQDAVIDVGYPWYKPDCVSTPDNWRCKNLHFSDPMFEILILLFTMKDRPLKFESDADMVGKTLCRPSGYFTHDLEKDGRLWLTNKTVTLKQPQSMKACFDMMADGEVDAVAINEFTGRTFMKELNLADKVDIVQSRPLSIEGLHVVVHKSHPRAQEILTQVNESLDGIKASGDYQRIIDTHMSRIWDGF